MKYIYKLLCVGLLLSFMVGCSTTSDTSTTTTTTGNTTTTSTSSVTTTTSASAPRLVAVGDATSSSSTIIYSDDYGATWTSVSETVYRVDMNCIAYDADSGIYYAGGDEGKILRSSSGEYLSWSTTGGTTDSDDEFYGITSNGEGSVVTVGVSYYNWVPYYYGPVRYRTPTNSNFYQSSDELAGGIQNYGYLYGVAVDDNNRFVAVGQRKLSNPTEYIAVARYSTDGGENWTEHNSNATVSLGTTVQLRDVAATESNTFYTVGNSGTVMLSSNGGSTWSSVSISAASGYTLYGIASDSNSSATTMVVVGSSGFLLRGTKSGSTWSWASVSSGTSAHLLDVATDGNGNWVAVGTGGKVIYSDDNAASWTAGVSGISRELYGVTFGD